MLAPTTLVCCGRSFCKECLHLWIKTNAQQGGIPRCPGGCMAKVPFRLPKHSIALRKAMEQLVPDRLACRIKAEEEEEEMPCFGGFKVRFAFARMYGSSIIVRQGSPGIVVGNCDDGCHLTVKFDEREDGSELCVNVVPEALMLPLPGGFRLHQRVVALYELLLNSDMKVPLGSVGHIIGSLGGDRVTVLFEPKQEKIPEYPVSVNIRAAPNCFNVLPLEILPWCDTPPEFPAGTSVRAVHHLMSPCAIIVHAGTRGIILGGVDPSLVFVSFENGPAVAAAISALETDTDAVGETACLGGSLESGREEPETCLERSEAWRTNVEGAVLVVALCLVICGVDQYSVSFSHLVATIFFVVSLKLTHVKDLWIKCKSLDGLRRQWRRRLDPLTSLPSTQRHQTRSERFHFLGVPLAWCLCACHVWEGNV
ncbi:unnamed protein product [Effrenium voratum]|nr:unnamed protein product [Effrenium voratum]